MKRWQLVALLTVLLIALAWFLYALYFAWQSHYDYKNIQANADFWGQIFSSGFAFVGNGIFFITLVQQTEELRLMREEHRVSREESRSMRELAERQEHHLRRQLLLAEKAARLQQFFNLRDILRELDAATDIPSAQRQSRRRGLVTLIANILDAEHFEPDEVAALLAIVREEPT